jgi:hypothetical protein
MKVYLEAFLVAGVIVPIALHIIASESMPWWPDTVSMGLTFGLVAVVMVSRARTNREMNRRLWQALRVLAGRRSSN